ncbi:MAG: DUF4364 family protein [Oscillospiraceae bacterium]|nr:DUF4364 family protein [Oscillospiraceae bacterium]
MPGFIHDNTDIKILLLYILNRLPEPVGFDALLELAMCDGGITYFDVTQCLDSLVKTGHAEELSGAYRALDKGRRDGGATESALPLSVKVRCDKGVMEHIVRSRRSASIDTATTIRRRGGYTAELCLSGDGDELMNLRLYAVSAERAAQLESEFKLRAEEIYAEIVGAIFRNV